MTFTEFQTCTPGSTAHRNEATWEQLSPIPALQLQWAQRVFPLCSATTRGERGLLFSLWEWLTYKAHMSLVFFSQLLSYCLQCLALAINTIFFSDLCVTSAETSLALLSPILIGSFGSNLSSYSFFLALLHYEDSVWEAETCQCWRKLCSATTLCRPFTCPYLLHRDLLLQ